MDFFQLAKSNYDVKNTNIMNGCSSMYPTTYPETTLITLDPYAPIFGPWIMLSGHLTRVDQKISRGILNFLEGRFFRG